MLERWLKGNKALPHLDVILAHPNYDDHWASCDARKLAEQVQAPILNVGGWFDIFTQSTLDTFTEVQSRGSGVARGNQKVQRNLWDLPFESRKGSGNPRSHSTRE